MSDESRSLSTCQAWSVVRDQIRTICIMSLCVTDFPLTRQPANEAQQGRKSTKEDRKKVPRARTFTICGLLLTLTRGWGCLGRLFVCPRHPGLPPGPVKLDVFALAPRSRCKNVEFWVARRKTGVPRADKKAPKTAPTTSTLTEGRRS